MALDWHGIFVPSVPITETMLRGTIIYLALFLLLRFLFKRQAGTPALTDLLLILLLSEATQNAMAEGHRSVTDGLILVLTLCLWDYSLDWLSFHVPPLRRLMRAPPLLLVEDGRLLRRNMQKELITREELLSQLREQGVEDLALVKKAMMEGDGRISVIKTEPASPGARGLWGAAARGPGTDAEDERGSCHGRE